MWIKFYATGHEVKMVKAENERSNKSKDNFIAERIINNSERKLADIIDFLPDATFVIDKEGKIIA